MLNANGFESFKQNVSFRGLASGSSMYTDWKSSGEGMWCFSKKIWVGVPWCYKKISRGTPFLCLIVFQLTSMLKNFPGGPVLYLPSLPLPYPPVCIWVCSGFNKVKQSTVNCQKQKLVEASEKLEKFKFQFLQLIVYVTRYTFEK